MHHLLGLARIPVGMVGGVLTAAIYMRLVWWLMAKRAAAIDAAAELL